MTVIAFQTPGLIDVSAFTTFGINSKPNTKSPIGFFGTGLKYAISVLLRHGIPIYMSIGSKEYYFYTKVKNFRDKTFDFVRMRKRGILQGPWSYEDLPFTTELGKNWQLWMAYRELEANTRDENGTSRTCSSLFVAKALLQNTDVTLIVIGDMDNNPALLMPEARRSLEELEAVYADRDNIFLTYEPEQLAGTFYDIEIIRKPSKSLYYRGMRVFDYPRNQSSAFTYNMLSAQNLTEDRTLASYWWAELLILRALNNIPFNPKGRALLRQILKSPKESYEASLDFDTFSDAPSDLLRMCLMELKSEKGSPGSLGYYLPRLGGYIDRWIDKPMRKKVVPQRTESNDFNLRARLEYWKEQSAIATELDLNEIRILLEDVLAVHYSGASTDIGTDSVHEEEQEPQIVQSEPVDDTISDEVPF